MEKPRASRSTLPAPPGDSLVRRRVTLPGGYELIDPIGHGGMGEVWRGWDPRLERAVAIKLGQGADPRTHARVLREGRMLARLRHPAIVTVFDVGRDPAGVPFVVMELLEGEDLGAVLEREGPVGDGAAVGWILPVLEGLVIAHENGVVHRDIKPDNVFLARQSDGPPRPVLVDFGIARPPSGVDAVTGGVFGTPAFMAPEQLRERGEVGPAADQWATAVTVYQLTTGRLPFGGANVADVFLHTVKAPLPFPRDGSMDSRLFAILARATRKDPADRFPSARAMAEALREWRATRPARPPSKPTFSTPPAPLDEPPEPAVPSLDDAIRRRFGDPT